MGTPFKMKGFSGFGNSPIKQDSRKTFERIKKMKDKAKKFVKSLDIKDVKKVTKTYGKTNPWVLAGSMLLGKTASADQPGTGTHGGKKVGSIRDMIKGN